MGLSELDLLLKVIASAAGAAGALWGIWLWLRRSSMAKSIRAFPGLADAMATIGRDLHEVKLQVTPNGGGSMRDAIGRIELGLADVMAATQANADGSMEGHVDVSTDGRWTWINGTLLRWLGADPARLVGWGWVNTLMQDQRNEVRAEWESAIEERREFNRRLRLRPLDGADPFSADLLLRPLTLNKDGSVRIWRLNVRRTDLTLRYVVNPHGPA